METPFGLMAATAQLPCTLQVPLEQLPDACLIVDSDGRVMAWNRAMAVLCGPSLAAACGEPFWEHLPEALGALRVERALVEQGVACESDVFVACLGRWQELRAMPSTDGLLVIARDIHERKTRELELAERAALFRMTF